MSRASILLLLSLLAGCTATWSADDLQDAVIRPDADDVLYYVGTLDGYHYFCLETPMRPNEEPLRRVYRVQRNELAVPNSFPLTDHRDQWRQVTPEPVPPQSVPASPWQVDAASTLP